MLLDLQYINRVLPQGGVQDRETERLPIRIREDFKGFLQLLLVSTDSRNEGDVCIGSGSVVRVLLPVVVEEVIQCNCPLWFTFCGNIKDNLC